MFTLLEKTLHVINTSEVVICLCTAFENESYVGNFSTLLLTCCSFG